MAEDVTADTDGHSAIHHMHVIAELSPVTHTAAVWVRAPTMEVELHDVPVNSLVMQAFRLNPIRGFMPRFQEPCKYTVFVAVICGIQSP